MTASPGQQTLVLFSYHRDLYEQDTHSSFESRFVQNLELEADRPTCATAAMSTSQPPIRLANV